MNQTQVMTHDSLSDFLYHNLTNPNRENTPYAPIHNKVASCGTLGLRYGGCHQYLVISIVSWSSSTKGAR